MGATFHWNFFRHFHWHTFESSSFTYLFSFQVSGQAIRPAMFMTPLQLQMHQQLKAKHAELFRKIIEQQEELRKVSEQLLMTQYGLVPVSAVAPVQLPLAQAPVAVVAQPLTANSSSSISVPVRGSSQTDIFGPQEMQFGYANVLSASTSQNNSQRNRCPQNR